MWPLLMYCPIEGQVGPQPATLGNLVRSIPRASVRARSRARVRSLSRARVRTVRT